MWQRSGRCPRQPPQAEIQVPSSGVRGPVGHTDVPTSRAASLPPPAHRFCARCLPPSRSPFFSTEPPWATTLQPLFPTSVKPPFPISMFLPFPVVMHPSFPVPAHPLLHSRSGLWPPPPGTVTVTMQQTPRAGDSKAAEGSTSSQARKAGRWLCNGTICPVQTPECLCCHLHALSPSDIPKEGFVASLALRLQREHAAGCCGPHQQLPKNGCGGTSSVVRTTRGLQESI